MKSNKEIIEEMRIKGIYEDKKVYLNDFGSYLFLFLIIYLPIFCLCIIIYSAKSGV